MPTEPVNQPPVTKPAATKPSSDSQKQATSTQSKAGALGGFLNKLEDPNIKDIGGFPGGPGGNPFGGG